MVILLHLSFLIAHRVISLPRSSSVASRAEPTTATTSELDEWMAKHAHQA